MCYHGQEISTEEKEENSESTFANKGNPTYAGFQHKTRESSSIKKPWIQGQVTQSEVTNPHF